LQEAVPRTAINSETIKKEETMNKTFLFLILSFIFISVNAYAYDDDHIINKTVCTGKDSSSCKTIKFSCNINSESEDNKNFNLEIKRTFPLNDAIRKCFCREADSNFLQTTYFKCACSGDVPYGMRRDFEFNWLLFGSTEMTCNHFINNLYREDYYDIDPDMIGW